MKRSDDRSSPRPLFSYFLLAVAVIVALKVILEIRIVFGWFYYFFSIISPFAIGFLVAYLLNIPASWLQKVLSKRKSKLLSRHSKLLGILAVYLLLLLLIALLVRLIIPAVSGSIAYFMQNFSTYFANAQLVIDYLNATPLSHNEITMDSILDALKRYSLDNLSGSLTASVDALSGVFSALFTTFLAFVSSIYILAEKDKFRKFACRALAAVANEPIYNGLLKYLRDLNTYFRQYIYCQTIDGMILGTLATLELLFIIRSPYALVLGVMLGVVNYIPYFGSIIGSLVAIAVVGFTQGFPMAVLAAVVLLVTQQIDGNLIQPRLMGSSFSLSPLLIIISITFGGSLAGPLGMIAAIPIVAVLKNMLDDLILFFEHRKKKAPKEDAV